MDENSRHPMNCRVMSQAEPPLSLLSYHGPDVTRLMCVDDMKLHLLQSGALTETEYEIICQPDVMRTRRIAAERVWEALMSKPDGFERLVMALEANVKETSHNSGHDELRDLLKGPEFDFEQFKSLVGANLSERICQEMVDFLLKVKVSEGRTLVHPSVLQGCNTWLKLFQQLERCRLCHALEVDLLAHAFDCVNVDGGELANLQSVLQFLASYKSSDKPIQENSGLTIPLPGFFLMAVETVDKGHLVTSRLRKLKDALSEALAITKHLFQYLTTVHGVHYYQFPLRYLDIFPRYLESNKVDLLLRPGITHITIRSDYQMMEFDLASANKDVMFSTYTVADVPSVVCKVDCVAQDRPVPPSRQRAAGGFLAVPSSEQPNSLDCHKKKASSVYTAKKDEEPAVKKGAKSCVADLSPGLHRRHQHVVRNAESWSPGPQQRRPCAKRVHTLTLFLVGPEGSGKSTFLRSYMGGQLSSQLHTGFDVKNKVISWNDYADIKITVWDMPGIQSKQDWTKIHMLRDADGFIFVADMCNFDNSLLQIKELRKKAGTREVRKPMVIVVNKCDGVHGSGPSDGQLQFLKKFVTEHKFALHFTASSKMDIGVQKVFEYVAARVLNSDTEYLQFTAP